MSKTKPFADIVEALGAGQLDFGENRIEELWEKVDEAGARGISTIRWHMIGSIQSRKAKDCVGPFALIHSVDRDKIAQRLSRAAVDADRTMTILFEVNVSGEESKHGFTPEGLVAALPALLQLPNLRFDGLMTMAPFVDDPEETRPVFRRLRQLLEKLRQEFPTERYPHATWTHLSMGMSNDFEVAIEEGATLVRIGTAIFGKRDEQHGN
ncbi:MAG: YggS family pyridoxal phosphate-dependent enzyme [Caldilineaceae bacterium]